MRSVWNEGGGGGGGVLLVLLVSMAFLTEEFWILGHSSGKKVGQEIRRLGKADVAPEAGSPPFLVRFCPG